MAAPRKQRPPDPAFGQHPPAGLSKDPFPHFGEIGIGADPSMLSAGATQAGIAVHGPTLNETRVTHYGAINHRVGEQGSQRSDR